jgi:hypothetical protein
LCFFSALLCREQITGKDLLMTTCKTTPSKERVYHKPDLTIGKHYMPKELSNILGVTIQTLTSLRRSGRGPKYVKFGFRNIIYSAVEVDKYLKEKERLSTSDTGNRNLSPRNDDL